MPVEVGVDGFMVGPLRPALLVGVGPLVDGIPLKGFDRVPRRIDEPLTVVAIHDTNEGGRGGAGVFEQTFNVGYLCVSHGQ